MIQPIAWVIYTPSTGVKYVEMNRASVDSVVESCAANEVEVIITPLVAAAPAIPEDFRLPADLVLDKQLHAGYTAKADYRGNLDSALWHTDTDGLFWCGSWYARTPAQLEKEALSTLAHVRQIYAQQIFSQND